MSNGHAIKLAQSILDYFHRGSGDAVELCDLARRVIDDQRRDTEPQPDNEWRAMKARWAQDRHVRGRTSEPPDDPPPEAA